MPLRTESPVLIEGPLEEVLALDFKTASKSYPDSGSAP